MAGNLRVTTLIANHNYGRYLEKAILSSLNQTYPNTICVIDDGSTDDSLAVLEMLHKDYKFTSIHKPKAEGPSAARNEGIRATKDCTDIWQILDADDEMYPIKIEKFVNVLQDKVYGMVYADYETFDEATPDLLIREYKKPYSKQLLLQESIIHSGAMFSKEALVKANIDIDHVYNAELRVAEDWELWLKLSRASLAYHIPEVLTKVRTHSNNATNSVNKETWNRCWKYIAEQMQAGIYN